MTAKEIIERIMTQHWDMAACKCWICEAGRELGYGAKEEYLLHNSEIKISRVTVDAKNLHNLQQTTECV